MNTPNLRTSSSQAYDVPARVRTYDSDMDIMHPLRGEMIDIALQVLPFDPSQPLAALDLGVGTGVFSKRFLEDYPCSRVVAIDGAAAMLELAKSRLGDLARRVQWLHCDFQSIASTILQPDFYDVVISSYALHHLTRSEKQTLLTAVVKAMKPGGWFLNADLVIAESAPVEQRIQELRVAGVTARGGEGDQRFQNAAATRQHLDDLEAIDKDQPLTLEADLSILRQAGIASAEVLWKEFRETVIGGPKGNHGRRGARTDLQIRQDDLHGPDIAALLREHLEFAAMHSPPESVHAMDLDQLRSPEVTFWSVRQGTDLVGCGALKELDATHGEIKSMRTATGHQRKGVATAMLNHILDVARDRGYRRLSLETGSMEAFEPARALYTSFGFAPCRPFADYVEDPFSVFMTLVLTERPASSQQSRAARDVRDGQD